MAAAYALFAAGLCAVLAALVPTGRGVDVVNNLVLILLGLASGSAFPSNALPDLLRLHITPNLPPAWFIEAVRGIQFGGPNASLWTSAGLKLAMLGMALTFLSAWFFRRKLRANSLA
jgi:hypothetical protein